MVVNKKAQVGPGMASRTSSSQPLPRKKVSTSPLATPARPSTPPPPLEPIPLPKKKAKPKKKAVKKRGWSFPDRVLGLFLVLFVAYALRVCPNDYGLQDPVCWGLAKYRTGVVDVYLVPPVRRVVDHPRVRPVVEKGAEVLRPVVRRAVRGVEEFVEPRYRAYLKPYVDPISRYASVVTPYVRKGYTTVSPYVRKGYTVVAPYVQRAYGFGRPRVVGAYRVCARRLGELRREFVDPHVGVLWIKVVELSRGHTEHVPPPSQAPELTTTPSEEPPTKEPVPTSSSAEPAPTSTSDPEELPTSEPASTSDPAPVEEPSQTSESAPTSTSEPASTPEPTSESASTPEPAPTTEDSVTTSSASSDPPTISDSESTSLATEEPSESVSTSSEYDDFLADLGIDFDDADTPVSNTPTLHLLHTPHRSHPRPRSHRLQNAPTSQPVTPPGPPSSTPSPPPAPPQSAPTSPVSVAAQPPSSLARPSKTRRPISSAACTSVSCSMALSTRRRNSSAASRAGGTRSPRTARGGEKVLVRVEEKLEALVREMGERVEKWATRVREGRGQRVRRGQSRSQGSRRKGTGRLGLGLCLVGGCHLRRLAALSRLDARCVSSLFYFSY